MIVAGEASGDLHGAGLVREANLLNNDLEFFGMGGKRLEQAGTEIILNIEGHGLMGFSEAVYGLKNTLSAFRTLTKVMTQRRPDVLVLIDYPEFNLRLAKKAAKLNIPVLYYISPQVWAWRQGRVRKIKKLVTSMAVIFPFEVEFYKKFDFEVNFVGHPLLDVMPRKEPKEKFRKSLGLSPEGLLLALMPGSRKSEIEKLLPNMLEAVKITKKKIPDISVALAVADTIELKFLKTVVREKGIDLSLIEGQTHALQGAADLVLATSGTVTLETAIMLTPMVVIYKASPLTYFIAKRLTNIQFAAMPNIIAGKSVVPELLQKDAEPDRIAIDLIKLIENEDLRSRMRKGLSTVRKSLGNPGAGQNTARLLLNLLNDIHNN